MTSRDTILNAIRSNKPQELSLPVIDKEAFITYPDLYAQFKNVLEAIGGQCFEADSETAALELIAGWEKGETVIQTLNSVPAGLPGRKAEELAEVDTAILRGLLAVAENGAIWVTEKEMGNRLLPFIAQQLIIVVNEEAIVPTLHQAYEKIKVDETGFGVFIAGPSKTADIEQSLVIGAHGPCGMKAVVIRKH